MKHLILLSILSMFCSCSSVERDAISHFEKAKYYFGINDFANAEKNCREASMLFEMAKRNNFKETPGDIIEGYLMRCESYIKRGKSSNVSWNDLYPINVTIDFFEGEPVTAQGKIDRVYKNKFPKRHTWCIYWELNAEHRNPQNSEYKIFANLYHNNNLVTKSEWIARNNIDWKKSYHYRFFGKPQIGMWELGNYKVEIVIDNETVASGTFEIF